MKKSVILSLLLLMCIGIGAQRVQKMSHDIRLLVNQTSSQMRRAPALTIRPADGGIRLSFDKAPSQPFTVRVYSLSGQLLGEQAVRPTAKTDYILPLSNASGVCVVQVNSPEQGITGSELIRK